MEVKMKAYGTMLALLAAVGCGSSAQDFERYHQAKLRQEMPAITRGIEERVRGEYKTACDARVKEEVAEAERQALNRSLSSATTTVDPVPYAYPQMDQPMHPLLERIAKGHYDGLASDTTIVSSQSGGQDIQLKLGSDCKPARDTAGAAEGNCYVEMDIEYSRKENTFILSNIQTIGSGGEGSRYTGIEFIGTGQLLRWEEVTGVHTFKDSSDKTSFLPADVADIYKPIFASYLEQIRSRADKELAELARPPKLE